MSRPDPVTFTQPNRKQVNNPNHEAAKDTKKTPHHPPEGPVICTESLPFPSKNQPPLGVLRALAVQTGIS